MLHQEITKVSTFSPKLHSLKKQKVVVERVKTFLATQDVNSRKLFFFITAASDFKCHSDIDMLCCVVVCLCVFECVYFRRGLLSV